MYNTCLHNNYVCVSFKSCCAPICRSMMLTILFKSRQKTNIKIILSKLDNFRGYCE